MKKFILTSLVAAAIFSAVAQPILTTANSVQNIGEIFTTRMCSFSSPGPGGASQNWNFSSVTPTAITSTSFVLPSSIPGSSIFSGATHASTDGNSIGFYAVNTNTLQMVGTRPSPTVNMVYSNREDLMRFPFTMGNSYADNFAATFTTTNAFYRYGTSTLTADGYGTLTTPAGTFNNVLRIHLQQVYKDSAWFGMPFIINYNNDQYMWFTPGIHYALLTISTLTNSIAPTSQFLMYLQNYSADVTEMKNTTNDLSLFPNPASSELNLQIKPLAGTNTEVIIFNSSGQELKRVLFASKEGNNFSLNISDLPDGIYLAFVKQNGVLSRSVRFVINK